MQNIAHTIGGLLAISIFLSITLLPNAHAVLTLDSVTFDPSIIASGDAVDIIIQYHADSFASAESEVASNDAYTFEARLLADDDLTREYVMITRSEGDQLAHTIIGGQVYADKFRVKVSPLAPAGSYQFKLEGSWYKEGVRVGSPESVKLFMDVKKEGISLAVANIATSPRKIRSADQGVSLTAQVSNSGEKTAKDVEIRLELPEGMSHGSSESNRINLGVIPPATSSPAAFVIDTDKQLLAGTYDIPYLLTYKDTDNNGYTVRKSFPLTIHKRPYLVVANVSGSGLAGDRASLAVTVTNVGEDVADSSDIRLIKQSSQPFEMDVRTQYLGQLQPGQSATAVFEIDVLRDAPHTMHTLTAALRAKGNSDDGDASIYTFTDAVTIPVTGSRANPYPAIALAGLILLAAGAGARALISRKSTRAEHRR